MNLTPQHKEILRIHQDSLFHCSTEIEFCRDQRKRISELNRSGDYRFEARKCDGRCGKNHSSNLFMRRLIRLESPLAKEFREEYEQRQLKVVSKEAVGTLF